eukprot:CAMPEP_0201692202 /NCGR_PEP_ID=MMETSP0578-20130828/5160_1 /ASSEMBLY_ACC=CAM_ASM_000663 /TAXON_ID=267565 /ORGANISM="Skeletonema grethea, Strain CCMP 1804" /LENGTH=371 /DNA_ID=CAMNT_0048177549 /DNA_START=1186 /DNA_END=2302 /DNA_ORIENTATION=+
MAWNGKYRGVWLKGELMIPAAEKDKIVRKDPPMNRPNSPEVSQLGIARSALSSQLEQFDYSTTLKSQPSTASAPVNKATAEKLSPQSRQYIQTVVQMIADERWHDLERFIKSPFSDRTKVTQPVFEPRSPPQWRNSSSGKQSLIQTMNNLSIGGVQGNSACFNPLEIVHFACKHNPPRKIIKLLALTYPDGVTLPDKMGRLPLHYAAQWGCSGRLMHYLVQKDTLAASTKDNLGKTPTHLICENYNANHDAACSMGLSCDEGMIWVLKLLLDASPDSVNIEDNRDMLPLEYAIESGAPYSVIKFLQIASEKDWKQRKEESMPGDTHSHIVQKLNRDQQLKQREHKRNRESKISLPSKEEQAQSKSMFAKSA